MVRGFSFSAIFLALLLLLNHFYVRTNGYKSLNGTYKFTEVPEGIQVANLGSSHGEFGFDYQDIEGLTCFNFGLRGQSHQLDLEILKKFKDRLAEGCTVIIPVSCFSYIQVEDYQNQHVIYYGILDYGSIPNHNPVEYLRFRLLPILSASFNAKYLIRDKKTVEWDIFAGRGEDEEYYKLNGMYYYGLFKDLMERQPEGANSAGAIEDLIIYCLDNGFKPVLVTTPFTDYYNYWFSGEVYVEFRAAMSRMSREYGVPYLDYSRDARFRRTFDFFADSDHLNPLGRKVFTRILLRRLGIVRGGMTKKGAQGRWGGNQNPGSGLHKLDKGPDEGVLEGAWS